MNDTPETGANPDVLEFYKTLPFNYHGSAIEQARMVRQRNMVSEYGPLAALLRPGMRVLEVGCGVGWFSTSMAVHHGCDVTAIDFNPVAVERAGEIAAAANASVKVEVADLFLYEPAEPFDVVVSLGVLHHTNDCLGAVRRVCEQFVRPGGHVFIGLYHLHGRRPFLQHFADMQANGASEEEMLARYRELHPELVDDTLAMSWFRDQALHPHETQHTVAEVKRVYEAAGVELLGASVNDFGDVPADTDLDQIEKALETKGIQSLNENRYYPGFFLCLGRKEGGSDAVEEAQPRSSGIEKSRIAAHAAILRGRAAGAPAWLADAVDQIRKDADLFPPIDDEERPPEFLYPH